MTATGSSNPRTGQEPSPSNEPSAAVVDPGVLTGAIITGIFGTAWTQWGASGLPAGISGVIRVVGIVVGLIIVVRSARLRRSTSEGRAAMMKSRAYRIVVVLEVVALAAGAAILSATGHSEYVAAWFAAVVGVHFLAFGHLFDISKFYWLGGALLVGAIAGLLVGLSGGGRGAIEATSGLIAAASLFAAGGWSVFGTRHEVSRLAKAALAF